MRDGPQRVSELVDWGVRFSRNEAGAYDLGREGDTVSDAFCT